MKNFYIFFILVFFAFRIEAQTGQNQKLSVHYEELTAPDFVKANQQSGGVCLLPFGIIEKHGPHLPLGTDLLDSRLVASMAAEKEYSVIFPPYYTGQINEARHQPGTISYSHELIWNMMQETCDELSRNGFKKIIIVNGHGGNNDFLRYFCMSQLHTPKDYVVMVFEPKETEDMMKAVTKLRKTTTGGHADEEETSMMLFNRPELVKQGMAKSQSGADQAQLSSVPGQYTGIWWYGHYPNHYAGDGSQGSKELGKLIMDYESTQLAELIKTIKNSNAIEDLQKKFYDQAANPLKTGQ